MSFNKHPANQVLYHALIEALIADEESMDKGVADSLKQQKKPYDDDDEDPFAGTNQGEESVKEQLLRWKWMIRLTLLLKMCQKILSVVNVKVQKLHGYGHLEEIVVRRADRQLYKFKEGNFVDLQLNDIEDMLLLVVQHKLFQLNGGDIVDLIVALHMFTRSLIIKRRVEDLQLSVESCQKKLNLTKPQNTFPGIKFKELYTLSFDPSG
ncbi:hypothetical protein Tco_0930182 [Tanacetum coccineum]